MLVKHSTGARAARDGGRNNAACIRRAMDCVFRIAELHRMRKRIFNILEDNQ